MLKNVWRIMFDYDDTLIRHNSKMELEVMAQYFGLKFNEEFIRQFSTFYSLMGDLSKTGVVTIKKYERLVTNAIPLLLQNNFTVYDLLRAERYKDEKLNLVSEGTVDVLEYLVKKGYYLCVFTNGFLEEQATSIRLQGLDKYFEKIYAWDNFYAKPNKRAFIRALAGTAPSENVMVGNSILHDIRPAKDMGIYTFGVNLVPNKKSKCLPDVELKSLIDLKMYL